MVAPGNFSAAHETLTDVSRVYEQGFDKTCGDLKAALRRRVKNGDRRVGIGRPNSIRYRYSALNCALSGMRASSYQPRRAFGRPSDRYREVPEEPTKHQTLADRTQNEYLAQTLYSSLSRDA